MAPASFPLHPPPHLPLVLLILILVLVRDVEALLHGHWMSVGGGLSGGNPATQALALAVTPRGFYVGGTFSRAGNVDVSNLAFYFTSNSSWRSVSGGATGGSGSPIGALALNGTMLFIGGGFSTVGGATYASHVAALDLVTGKWSDLAGGCDNSLFALALFGERLFAGGQFRSCGGVSTPYIAAWSGGAWGSLGGGLANPGGAVYVRALSIMAGAVWVGGQFALAGPVAVSNVAAFDLAASKWWANSSIGLPADTVRALGLYRGRAVVGGIIDVSGSCMGIANRSVVKGGFAPHSSWSCIGNLAPLPGIYPTSRAFVVYGGRLVVGGAFVSAGGVNATNIAAFDVKTGWTPLGPGLGDGVDSAEVVYALAALGNGFVAAGTFASAGSTPGAANLAFWRPSAGEAAE